jgi:hypothetical protein
MFESEVAFAFAFCERQTGQSGQSGAPWQHVTLFVAVWR